MNFAVMSLDGCQSDAGNSYTGYHTLKPMIDIYLIPCASTKFQGKPLQQGHKLHGGGKNLRFSTEITIYLGNGTR